MSTEHQQRCKEAGDQFALWAIAGIMFSSGLVIAIGPEGLLIGGGVMAWVFLIAEKLGEKG